MMQNPSSFPVDFKVTDAVKYRPLSNESWSHIFTYVDSYDLWISCRGVSKWFRAEAEMNFAE